METTREGRVRLLLRDDVALVVVDTDPYDCLMLDPGRRGVLFLILISLIQVAGSYARHALAVICDVLKCFSNVALALHLWRGTGEAARELPGRTRQYRVD